MNNSRKKKGFTLAELLIVVAIIAVLVAISIPIFTNQLEKAREATDLANIRSAYAECSAAVLTEDTSKENGVTYTAATDKAEAQASKDVKLTQKKADWQTSKDTEVGGQSLTSLTYTPAAGDTVTVTVKGDGTWTLAKKAGN